MAVSVTYRDFRMNCPVPIGGSNTNHHPAFEPKRSSLDEQQPQKMRTTKTRTTKTHHKHQQHHQRQRQRHHHHHRKKNYHSSRTLAIEQAYVHDVYTLIAQDSCSNMPCIPPVHSYVQKFVQDFDPGSIMLDIGCGDGQCLDLRPDVLVVGLDRCSEWFHHGKYHHLKQETKNCLLVGNVLYLPFRDEFFDGILCCGVLHHLSTLERRIKALKEIARIMKIGAKILLTVTSSGFNDVRSQDVLIRVDNFEEQQQQTTNNPNDCPDYIGNLRTTSNDDDVQSMVGENYSSPSSSELENCYSFFKKAIKRFSLASSQLYPFRNSFEEPTNQLPGRKIVNTDYYPIELRNLDDRDDNDDRPSCPSSKSSSTEVDSALSSFNRSGSVCSSQTSSNQAAMQFPSSILTVIKDHLISWKSHLTNSFEQQWQSFELKDTIRDVGDVRKNSYDCQPQSDSYHRFSLPIGFWRSDPTNNNFNTTAPKTKLSKNKIYASKGFEKRTMLHEPDKNGPSDHKDIRLDETTVKQSQRDFIDKLSIIKSSNNRTTDHGSLMDDSTKKPEPEKPEPEHGGKCSIGSDTSNRRKILPRKSFSGSESSHNSVHYSRYKLLAFYSMPELSTLFGSHTGQDGNRRRSDSDCKPKAKSQRLNSKDSANEHQRQPADEILKKTMDDVCTHQLPPPISTEKEDDSRPEEDFAASTAISAPSLPTTETTEATTNNNSTITTTTTTPTTTTTTMIQKPKAIDVSKFTKKLLRQRSFSADYQPETVKIPPDPPRRFSASPNIETHRYNKSDHIPHNQQISMDSEESFVTIIPAHNNSNADNTINNFSDNNLTDFDIEDEDDCTNNQLFSPNTDMYSCSSEEEEAYCESFENDCNTSNDTSISSVLEATIKSISRSDSMDSHDEITTISSMEEISHEENDSDPSVDGGGDDDNATHPSNTMVHQYYHLFCSGELEQIIEDHVQNLHVIDSFYSECAMSWCVIAEKIHVWTI